MPDAPRLVSPSGIAGPGGTYFHKNYGGNTNPKSTLAEQRAAVIHTARHSTDREDFAQLITILGLDKPADNLRRERRTGTDA